MAAPPSQVEQLKLCQAKKEAEELHKKLLEANKLRARMILLSIGRTTSEVASVTSVTSIPQSK